MTCDTKRHWILSVVCRSSARFIMRVEIMNRESKRIRKTILCVMKSIVKSYRQKGFVFWKMKVAIFCWEINRFISADWNPLIVNKNSARRMSPLKMYADAWEKSILQEIRKNSRRQQRISQTTVITFCLPTIHPIWKLIRNVVPI